MTAMSSQKPNGIHGVNGVSAVNRSRSGSTSAAPVHIVDGVRYPSAQSAKYKLAAHFIGGSRLDAAQPSAVRNFVASHDGHTVISSVLIANNGIAAVKEIRSVRKWAYETFGDERAIQFVVMATPEDLKANADYIRMADQYVEVPGGTNNNNYANVDLIVDIAERMGVDAVWAGWGHASENPKLPESLAASKKKIVFIGPPGSAMRSLGDKISSTIVAQHAKVPCIPWSGTGVDEVVVDKNGIVTVADNVYSKGCTHSVEEGLVKAKEIGFPVMIKASEGGGGKGIRKVEQEEEFQAAYAAVLAELPGSPIFIMKLAGNARHLEVQLLADQYGNNISLFGRDCSVQRRHQKIIEEAPVTVAKPETFHAMERAAVSLGRLVGYVSAGTVEYLYSYADDKFYFLELNPRLQVEHPTTEMVTGVNLPAAQLQIAMGIPLHRIQDIRMLYGADTSASSEIDFDFSKEGSESSQRRPKPKGHTTACRITSEDPGEGFKPSSGTLHDLNFRSSSNVWGYFSVGTAGGIHSFSDSQFGHIFAFGETREASRKHMVVALKEMTLRGEFRTTVEYLIKLLETPAFGDNTISTGWLDELISKKLTVERPDTMIAVVCGAAVKAHIASEACLAEYLSSLEKGQVPPREVLKSSFPAEFIYEGNRFRFQATRSSQDSYLLFLNGSKCTVGVRPLADGGLLVLIGGRSHSIYWKEETGATRLSVDSKTCLLEQENDPTQLRSPSPGKLAKFLVESGEHVRAGQAFAEVEVMKMYMPLIAKQDGVVQLIKQVGATLEAGDILGILALDDPSQVKHATPFDGKLPDYGTPVVTGDKPPQIFAARLSILRNILDGYDNSVIMQATIKELVEVLRNPKLPYGEWSSHASALHSRMPQKLYTALAGTVDRAKKRDSEFPAKHLQKQVDRFVQETLTQQAEIDALRMAMGPLLDIIMRYSEGLKAHEFSVFLNILGEYHQNEKLFSGANVRDEDVVLKLRDENKEDLTKVVQNVLSHSRVGSKNNLVLAILEEYKPNKPHVGPVAKFFRPILKLLSELESRPTAKVALKAREVLIQCAMPSLEERKSQMKHILRNAVTTSTYGDSGLVHRLPDIQQLKDVIDSKYTVFDVLPLFFADRDAYVSLAALETYVRRAYRAYTIAKVDYATESEPPYILSWDFQFKKVGVSESMVSQPMTPGTATPANELLGGPFGMKRISSMSDFSNFHLGHDEPMRKGVMVPVEELEDAADQLRRALELLPQRRARTNGHMPDLSGRRRAGPLKLSNDDDFSSVINVAVKDTQKVQDESILEQLLDVIDECKEELLASRVRRCTFICGHSDGSYPGYFTFRGPEYVEDETIRHIEPALAFQLELGRLSNFKIRPVFTENRNIHVYLAEGKENPSDKRFFTRAVVRTGRLQEESMPTAEYLTTESHRLVNDILDALEIIGNQGTDMNHIFINFGPTFNLVPEQVQEALGGFIDRFGRRLWRLRVTGAEIRIVCTDPQSGANYPVRVIVNNVMGFVIDVEMYMEKKTDKGQWVMHSIMTSHGKNGSMHLRPVNSPYTAREWLQPKRYKAHLTGTQYVYDFPELFRQAIQQEWAKAVTKMPELKSSVPELADMLDYSELVEDENGGLAEVSREPGSNNHGMIGWIATAKTPEFKTGRKFIIIANDITYQIGSFGPQEDRFFDLCTQKARAMGIPRIYLSANSGARMGLADELIPRFCVAWNDASRPEAGFKYLYLTPETYAKFEESKRKEVVAERIVDDGEERYKITTIVGAKEGLGVESLKGSGLIAGATSRAYEDIFTCTLVTCRSVGIGAYLVRLGQRAIQVEGQPIILTGAPAINKLLGREVYTSNLQLGGTQIMYKNGVSHLKVEDDFQGVKKIVEWLAYVPAIKHGLMAISPFNDPWDRDVEYMPEPRKPYDPRWLIAGTEDSDGEFLPGLFDKDSFQETLSGWARTVVVGRARLGGMPMGVIAVESRTIENVTPADPANAESTEQVTQEAGGVWYPNSAYKTAQAINDFNRGEQLPLMILANWRGFSGGQRDMYNEVLKYGSMIVDALTKYEQPVFVYIPPFGELRGGSWVVVDPSINADMMEMYADEEARGGVLEPDGIVNIKFRRDKQLDTMARLDQTYGDLKRSLQNKSLSPEEVSEIKTKMTEREELLMPVYMQVSLQFADLHDRAGRMMAKGVIRKPLQWQNARRYFYWRLRRRTNEEIVYRQLAAADRSSSRAGNVNKLTSWYLPSLNGANPDDIESTSIDQTVAQWIEKNQGEIQTRIKALKQDSLTSEVKTLLASLSVEDRQAILASVAGS